VKYDKRLLLLELRSVECPGIGNYKRYRIFGGISHTSNVVTLQTLGLLEGWKSWRWAISEVSLYWIQPHPNIHDFCSVATQSFPKSIMSPDSTSVNYLSGVGGGWVFARLSNFPSQITSWVPVCSLLAPITI